MQFERLLLIFLAIVALCCLVQSVFLIILAMGMRRHMPALTRQLATLARQLEQGMETVSRALVEARPPAARIQVSLAQARHLWTQWTGQVRHAATRLDEMLDLGREKLQEFDKAMERAVDRIQTRTAQAQQSILRPSVKLPAIVEGFRAAVHRYVEIRGHTTQSKASSE